MVGNCFNFQGNNADKRTVQICTNTNSELGETSAKKFIFSGSFENCTFNL